METHDLVQTSYIPICSMTTCMSLSWEVKSEEDSTGKYKQFTAMFFYVWLLKTCYTILLELDALSLSCS